MGTGSGKTSLPEGVEGVFEPMQTTQPGHANTVCPPRHVLSCADLNGDWAATALSERAFDDDRSSGGAVYDTSAPERDERVHDA